MSALRLGFAPLTASAFIFVCLSACSASEPTLIDGASPEAFARTTEQARSDLPVADRLTFDTALRTIGGRRYANNDPEALARRTFDGMTAAQVVKDFRERQR